MYACIATVCSSAANFFFRLWSKELLASLGSASTTPRGPLAFATDPRSEAKCGALDRDKSIQLIQSTAPRGPEITGPYGESQYGTIVQDKPTGLLALVPSPSGKVTPSGRISRRAVPRGQPVVDTGPRGEPQYGIMDRAPPNQPAGLLALSTAPTSGEVTQRASGVFPIQATAYTSPRSMGPPSSDFRCSGIPIPPGSSEVFSGMTRGRSMKKKKSKARSRRRSSSDSDVICGVTP